MATIEQHAHPQSNGAGTLEHLPVLNPATGETVGHVPSMGASEVEALVARARAAQPIWNSLGYKGRGAIMRDFRRWLVQNRDRLLETIVAESGKTREDAQLAELVYVADSLGFWAKHAEKFLRDRKMRPHSPFLLGRRLVERHRPYGVVGVIGPWNYPLTNNFGDCIPALMAGNTVVLKPATLTPLTSLLVAEGLKAVGIPDDVFLVATGGGGETGKALIDQADMIMFTGSTDVGKKIMAQASERLTPISLELGGNDPMIVLEDADLERAANAAVFYSMSNSGQTCISIERCYAHEDIHDEFVSKVVEKTRKLRQGEPGGPGSVEVGAITFEDQLELLDEHVADAVEKGARVLTGGRRREGRGDFFEPTVLTGVDHSMRIMTEETFGPTLPIMRVPDEEEAIRLANDSIYGLDSSVWTRDVARGERVARRLETGGACVNDAIINYLATEVAFGGAKQSGIGARHSVEGIKKYCQSQAILITRFAPKREVHFFPHSRRMTKLLERFIVLMYGRGARR
ncbi:MAG: aldehyde dehydrogenase family protein [Thermoleophilaceae bacterium]